MRRFKTITLSAMFLLLFSSVISAYGDGSISGTVSYSGTQTGAIYVAVFNSPLSCSPPNPGNPYAYIEIASLGNYTLSGLPDGTYYMVSVIITGGADADMKSTDPWGIYNGCGSITPVVISGGNAVSEININLVDGTIENPNPFYEPPYKTWGFSAHGGGVCLSGYWVELGVDDAKHTATSVSVTGPGISGSLALVYDIDKNRWASSMSSTGNPSFGNSPPTPPLTYTFTITDTSGTIIKTELVESFVEVFAANLSPSGGVTIIGNPVFSWTGVGGDYKYSVGVHGNNINWHLNDLTTTSVAYGGPPLTGGETYWWHADVQDIYRNVSMVCETFVYVKPDILGDMNGDDIIDISDVILVLRIALKLDPVQPCSDINNDGIVDISDVILTLRMALKIDPLQQCS